MYFFIFIVCLNTIASMINTNPFFDFAGPVQTTLQPPPASVASDPCHGAAQSGLRAHLWQLANVAAPQRGHRYTVSATTWVARDMFD